MSSTALKFWIEAMKICEHIVYVHVIVIANFCNKRMAASKDMRY